jgi:hypothetical protein
MATRRWVGRAGAVPQVTTVTVTGTVAIGDTFTLTINTRAVTGTATVGTTTGAVDAMVLALGTTGFPEFGELTYSQTTNVLTFTGPADGAPFTISPSTSGSAGIVSSDTSPTGPHHWSNVNNWREGSAPANGDDVVIDEGPSIKYGIDQNAVTLNTLTIGPNFPATSEIGLPRNTQPGSPETGYAEYREQYLRISATVVTLNTMSPRIRLNLGSAQAAVTVNSTGSARNDGEKALDLLGTHANNVVRVNKGQVGIAHNAGSVSTVATLTVAYRDEQSSDSDITIGSGVTLATVKQTGGRVELNCAATTVTREGGSMERWGAGAIGTLNNRVGTFNDNGIGTITTLLNVAEYHRRGVAPLTITNTTAYAGSVTRDPAGVVTWTNAPEFVECVLSGGPSANDQGNAVAYFDFGRNKKITVADI